MATRLTYNGVTLHNVTTREFRQEIIYDASNTDLIGSRFFITVDGVIHNQRATSSDDLEDGLLYVSHGNVSRTSSTSAIYDHLKRLLSEPRKELKFYVGASASGGGDGVLTIAPISKDKNEGDIENGPKPVDVRLISIVGSSVFRVRFSIQAAVGLVSGGQANVVLNNRWSLHETMDENFFTERRIDGTLRLAYSTLSETGGDGSIPAHVHKFLCIPALESGFKRRSINFGCEPDGLTCVYTVVDKQTHTAAPWPATSITGTHTESMADGVSFVSQVQIRLQGPPHIDKRFLIERAVQVTENRLAFINEPSAGEVKQQLLYAEIVDHIGDENAIEMTVKMRQLLSDAEGFSRLLTGTLGTPLELEDYDRKLSAVPKLYGYDSQGGERRPTVLWLLHCYLQTPGSGVHGINDNKIIREESVPELLRSETQVIEQETHEIEKAQHSHYSTDHFSPDNSQSALYTMSKIVSEYDIDDMKVAMPFSIRYPPVSGGATNVVLDLCEPQTRRRVEVDVERLGRPPQIGTPLSTYTDGTLVATRMKHNLCVFPPILSPDGRDPVYRIKATTFYSLSRPLVAGEKFRIGVHPYTKGLEKSLTANAIYSDSLDPAP